MTNDPMTNLAKLGNGIRSRRQSSYDPTGGNHDVLTIPAGGTVTIAEMTNPGILKHIWMTTFEKNFNLRALVLRMYWDGEETPSVQCPLGDFFLLGHGAPAYVNSRPIQSMYLGMNCWFAMPFESAVITVTNDADYDSILYFYFDYHEVDQLEPGLARFHASWRRELVAEKPEQLGLCRGGYEQRLNTTGKENYLVLEAEGKGHYVGCAVHLDTNEPGWWGEGDDMFFIDGDVWPPTLHGTGMEDYFCGAWNYNQLKETFNAPQFGYSYKGNSDYTGKHSQYRFHLDDPIYFEQSLRFSIEHGHANDRQGDWSSTAYWYQIGRTRPLPDTGTFEERIPYKFGGWEHPQGKDRKSLPY
ncbi:glycoside hydrolase family 172 protein [Paenibacillus silvisoli]|uniref:glycoside hydrolase family 172 protein n=1 Tax=Paenibacillus silvisoli TaxID=3110539 RepID=UPI00280534C5|nr:DUF2961 domain-containing protein [Paenibacillus silvisoli]